MRFSQRGFFHAKLFRMETGKLGTGIVGHATVLRILESRLSQPANGYVFFGVPHLGKRTVAERFVSALLSDPTTDYQLQTTNSRIHPDLIVLEPEEGKTQVSVEQVRKARARLSERPMVASRCVLFVPDANRMNEEGWNALLKVLEEPPAGARLVSGCGVLEVGRARGCP